MPTKEQYSKNRERYKQQRREWVKLHPNENKAYQHNYYIKKKEKLHFQRTKRVYGINKELYIKLYKQQNGKCAICGVQQLKLLDIDHCHISKEVRGLLCRRCNIGIGALKHSPIILQSAMNYLNKEK